LEGVEWTKEKYTHNGLTLRHPFEILIAKNRTVKIGTVCGGGVVCERKEGE
jgi:hypothetical protein